jgi:hypothetical protein
LRHILSNNIIQSIDNKVIANIKKAERGSLFFVEGFLQTGNAKAVSKALERLVQRQELNRVARGLYARLAEEPILGPLKPSSEYVLPRVQIEVSCRSLRELFTIQTFGSLVDEVYAERDFAAPLFELPTVNPARTFLEKLFLLHEEFHLPADKMRVDRLSRHLYDVHQLAQAGITESAFGDKELYEMILSHRYKFSRVGEVNYNNHNPQTLNPIPSAEVIGEWEADYTKMKEDMIYDGNKPSFEDLINNLEALRVKLQAVAWDFDCEFPNPAP